LHSIPELFIDDGMVLTGIGDAFVFDFAPIDPVPQEMVERTPAERAATENLAGDENTLFAADTLLVKLDAQFRNTSEREIAPEDEPDVSASASFTMSLRSFTL
jgi:hypothetical protein